MQCDSWSGLEHNAPWRTVHCEPGADPLGDACLLTLEKLVDGLGEEPRLRFLRSSQAIAWESAGSSGHRHLSTTMRYMQLSPSERERAIGLLNGRELTVQ